MLASAPGVPLLVAHGTPGAAVERHEGRFLLGLVGAVLAIVLGDGARDHGLGSHRPMIRGRR